MEIVMQQALIQRFGQPYRDAMTTILDIAFNRALEGESCLSERTLAMTGMSGRLYRHFINDLIRMTPNARYLEVGSWAGSTACAAMERNVCRAFCIDNWSLFGGPRDSFFENVEAVKSPVTDFAFLEEDFRKVDTSAIGRFNVYLFDGPHEEKDQYDGLALYREALDDELYFIVDDWNWPFVRSGTMNAIHDAGYAIDYRIEVRTTSNDEHTPENTVANGSDWHNGYLLAKLSRKPNTLAARIAA